MASESVRSRAAGWVELLLERGMMQLLLLLLPMLMGLPKEAVAQWVTHPKEQGMGLAAPPARNTGWRPFLPGLGAAASQ